MVSEGVFVVSDGTAAVDVSANTEDTLHTILNLRQGVQEDF